jgi:hypothetical protein
MFKADGKRIVKRPTQYLPVLTFFHCDTPKIANEMTEELNEIIKKFCKHKFTGKPATCACCGQLAMAGADRVRTDKKAGTAKKIFADFGGNQKMEIRAD